MIYTQGVRKQVKLKRIRELVGTILEVLTKSIGEESRPPTTKPPVLPVAPIIPTVIAIFETWQVVSAPRGVTGRS